MLTGMWHGAAWNFIGRIYYGVVLVLEKYAGGNCGSVAKCIAAYLCISYGAGWLGIFSLVQALEQHFVTFLQWLVAEQDLPVKKYSL